MHGILLAWALVVRATVTCGDDLRSLEQWLALLDEMALPPPTPAVAAQWS